MVVTPRWIDAWANEYDAAYDEGRIGSIVGKPRPSYSDIEAAYRWKNARGILYFHRNDPAKVTKQVRSAIDVQDEAAALSTLMGLFGVKARVASAILAVFRPERYTVMDNRAWASLRAHGLLSDLEDKSWSAAWPGYLAECRRLARENNVTLRRLDQALWAANGDDAMPKKTL